MSEYNGHPSYEHWNVTLWLSNDEGFYELAKEYSRESFVEVLSEFYKRTGDGVEVTPELAEYAYDCITEE